MLEIPASFRSLHCQRSARLTRSGGFEPERRPVPGYHLVPGTALDTAQSIIGPQGSDKMAGGRLGAVPVLSAKDKAAPFAANLFRRADA